MTIRPLRRLGYQMLLGSGAVTSLLLGWSGSGTLLAQSGGGPNASYLKQEAPAVPRNFLNKQLIQLPVDIKDSVRPQIQEIHLYMKDHPTAAWKLRDKVQPQQRAFTVQVPRDGEYWFTMVTVDKQGRAFPSDLRNEPAGMSVVIDTQAPQIELTNLGVTPEGQLIQCDISDANLDMMQTRFTFQGGDNTFRPAETMPGRPNVYCVPAQAVFTGVVRVIAQDMAKNQAQREMRVSEMPTHRAVSANSQQPLPTIPDPKTPGRLPTNLGGQLPELLPNEGTKSSNAGARPDGTDGPRMPDRTSASSPIGDSLANNVKTTSHTESIKRQVVNSPKVFLDYQIENGGAGGIKKVEVWITRDQAKTWQKLSEDSQRKSPVEVQFPGDGLFGVTLIASSGQSATAAPTAKDTPDWWIEVDTTKPIAQITKVHSVTEDKKSVVHIHWTSHDKNLGDTPVELYYATTAQGPWLPIAKGLKSEGQYRWSPPRDIGTQAHIQLQVRDLAGNTSLVQTLAPVLAEEVAHPRAVIRGITTGSSTGGSEPSPLPIVQP